MPRNNHSRKSSGRQLSKTELLILEEQQQKRTAMRQQRHREYLGRQQRRDNKARKAALKTSGYKPSWMIERERQQANSKQHVKQTPSFGFLSVEDDDEKTLRKQQQDYAKAPKPVKASACSGVWARGLAVKPAPKPAPKPAVKPAPKPVEKPVMKTPPKSTRPASTDAPLSHGSEPLPRRTGWDSDDDEDDDESWPSISSSSWADEED